MKFGVLKSIGHNISDSFASGIGLMIGVYDFDVFDVAQQSADGFIEVDFLSGRVSHRAPTEDLKKVVALYAAELPNLRRKHRIEIASFRTLGARFGVDRLCGRHFRVTVEDFDGHHSVDQYVGSPGRRLRPR